MTSESHGTHDLNIAMSSPLDGNGVAAAREAIRYLSHSETPWSDEQVGAVINAYFAAAKTSEERKRRAAGPSSVKWPMPDPLAKYKALAPSQTAVEPVAMWAYRDSFSKPDEWDVTFDAKEAQAITEAVAAGEEGYACEPLIFASTLTAQAAALVAAEKERDHARGFVERLQAALFFWMPSVRPETDVGLARSAGDDAYLLAGYSGEGAGPCWRDDMIARAEAAEKRIAELEAGLDAAEAYNEEHGDPADTLHHGRSVLAHARRRTHQEKNNAG